jgi:hypothetical protein
MKTKPQGEDGDPGFLASSATSDMLPPSYCRPALFLYNDVSKEVKHICSFGNDLNNFTVLGFSVKRWGSRVASISLYC